jgi:hypothetical protein
MRGVLEEDLCPPCVPGVLGWGGAVARSFNRSREHTGIRDGLTSYVAIADDNELAYAWHAVDNHIQQRRSRLEEVWIGGKLCDMKHDRPIIVNRIRVVELHEPLAHVHRMRCEPSSDKGDHRRVCGVVRVSDVRVVWDDDVEAYPTVGKYLREVKLGQV